MSQKKIIHFEGKEYTRQELASKLGIKVETLIQRLKRNNPYGLRESLASFGKSIGLNSRQRAHQLMKEGKIVKEDGKWKLQ